MPSQLILPLDPGNAMTRADFIEAPGNARALAYLDSWPDWPHPVAALHGPAASGKTHLARIWAERSGALLMDAQSLSEPIAGPAVVENCDGAGNPACEPALFAMMERGVAMLLTGRTSPSQWRVEMPDLVSRFRATIAFALGEPDEALLMALAVKLFADRQVAVPEAVVVRLVQGLERSPAAIHDFIARVDARALSRRKPINLQLVRELMAE
jgi:chromosomal replication initiation ATPase DnaA